jgi:hypothetical protein
MKEDPVLFAILAVAFMTMIGLTIFGLSHYSDCAQQIFC